MKIKPILPNPGEVLEQAGAPNVNWLFALTMSEYRENLGYMVDEAHSENGK